MKWWEIIITVASVMTAIGIICGSIVKFYRLIKSIGDKIDKIKEHLTENYIATLRLTVMSEEMPLEERIAAADKYKKLGGNGVVSHKYEQLIKQLGKNKG